MWIADLFAGMATSKVRAGVGVTVLVQGTVLTGTTCAADEFLEWMLASMGKSLDRSEANSGEFFRDAAQRIADARGSGSLPGQEDTDNAERESFPRADLYLKNVRVYGQGLTGVPTGGYVPEPIVYPFFVVRMDQIGAFTPGVPNG